MPEEIHVGDLGTRYYCRCLDRGRDFDPSEASTKTLIFKLPDGTLLTKTASIETTTDEGRTRWYLVYYADDPALPAISGALQIQGFLAYPSGRQWHSDVRTTDDEGAPLAVHDNLEADA